MQLQTGDRFGRLTVVQLDHIRTYIRPNNKINYLEYYLCICDCGRIKITQKNNLVHGDTKSCGCYSTECKKNKNIKSKKHGLYNTILYNRWKTMKERCLKPYNSSYKYYGGRGIKICKEWQNDFLVFFNWAINNGFKKELTLDRIDVNGDYCPENCRWITIKEQNFNKRNNRFVVLDNQKATLTTWCEKYNISRQTVYKRLNRGWSIEKALKTPSLIHQKQQT